ncbi:MAG TPA: hypothetical protein VFD57_05480 [Clostridia bacterium]|nr:hypothetical protein [Clostridia bacterium]
MGLGFGGSLGGGHGGKGGFDDSMIIWILVIFLLLGGDGIGDFGKGCGKGGFGKGDDSTILIIIVVLLLLGGGGGFLGLGEGEVE